MLEHTRDFWAMSKLIGISVTNKANINKGSYLEEYLEAVILHNIILAHYLLLTHYLL